jgi:hypothetical protein
MASGTSGAVPTIAAIITLVNDARIAAGKKPVGQSEALNSRIENRLTLLTGFINPTVRLPHPHV